MTALRLPRVITHNEAVDCAAMLSAGVQSTQGSIVLVDAAALEKFDSSALAVLLQCKREANRAGKIFTISSIPQRLRDLASLYGIQAVLLDGDLQSAST